MSHEPFSSALLSANWAALAKEAAAMGPHYWDRSNLWASAALLVRSGHGDVLVRLYDQSQPLIRSGEVDVDLVAVPGTILALRNAGRAQDAARLLSQFAKTNAKLPDKGLGGRIKEVNLAQIAALSGRSDEALKRLDLLSREAPLVLITIPSMSLFNSPFYRQLKCRCPAAPGRRTAARGPQFRKAKSGSSTNQSRRLDKRPQDAFDEELTLHLRPL